MQPDLTVAVRLSPRRILQVVGAIAGANLLMLAGTYLYQTIPPGYDWRIQYILRQFNLAGENRAAVWYSSMLLLAVSLAALGCLILDLRRSRARWDRLLSYGWLFVAAAFAGLSLDELGSLHERLGTIRGLNAFSEQLPGWVGVLAIPIGIMGLFFFAFAWLRVRQSTAAFVLMSLGLVLFLSVPFQEHIQVLTGATTNGPSERPAVLTLMEEGAELFASLCFLAAGMLYARMAAGSLTDGVGEPEATFCLGWKSALAAVALLAFGMAAVQFGILRFVSARGAWGDPMRWFPSALSFLVVLVSWYGFSVAARRTDTPWSAAPLLLLALFSLLLSVDYGSGKLVTAQFWSGRADRRLMLDVLLSLGALAVAGALWVRPMPAAARAAVGTWAVLLVASFASGGAVSSVLAFAAYAVLFPALGGTLAAKAPTLPEQRVQSGIAMAGSASG